MASRSAAPRKRVASARAAAAAAADDHRQPGAIGERAEEKAPPAAPAAPAPPQQQQRCVHCAATQTPLWRAGPAGPKTLCNACGVRWKKTGSVVARSRRGIGKTTRNVETRPLRAPAAVRLHTASTATYESVFTGLMAVPRAARTRTRTARAQRFFDHVNVTRGHASPPPLPQAISAAPSTDPAVYVTETLAPSPSPSPPPIPRVEPMPEGQGFRIVMHVKRDHADTA